MADKEYIERDEAVRKAIDACIKVVGHGITQFDAVDIAEMMDTIPTDDVELVRHGEWIKRYRGQKSPEGYYYWNTPLTTVFVCSECGRHEDKQEPYCHCGAKMDGKDKQ